MDTDVTVAPAAGIVRLERAARLPDRDLVGGKAWSIARLAARDLPVPPAFVIPTTVCREFHESGDFPTWLQAEVEEQIGWLSQMSGRRFGGAPALLVSVRSGAPISMPGMMDTVLNLGVSRSTLAHLVEEFDEAFAHDTLRRFLEMYVSTVLRQVMPPLNPEAAPDEWYAELDSRGHVVPDDPMDQLLSATEAVFDSWQSRRAKRYRQSRGISDALGTAVTVQAMVFGNKDDRSGTGVLFSRDPRTGDQAPYGQYLARAQGEDVVSGRVDPLPLSALAESMPEVHENLLAIARQLETEDHDIQDIEFTVEDGRLFILQTRVAARAPGASVRVAVDMVDEGILTPAEAVRRVTSEQARVVLRPQITGEPGAVLATGEPASSGVGVGLAVADPDEAERLAAGGTAVVLVRETTSPEDVHGMIASVGVVTAVGGGTSHAAVVGRALGVPCVVGCGVESIRALVGRQVTIDGETGKIYDGAAEVVAPVEADDPYLSRLLSWAEEVSPITVELRDDANTAIDLDDLSGAIGVDDVSGELAGVTAVKGAALRSAVGVRAVLDAGVRHLVTDQQLPAHLEAISWAEEKA